MQYETGHLVKTSYKLILAYKGTNYSGWQFQTTNSETVQNYVEKVLASITSYQKFQVIGASRTDTGVHASGQVLKVVLPRDIAPHKLLLGMNSKLPSDIRVLSASYIDGKFNVNLHTESKEYHYYFSSKQVSHSNLNEIIYYHSESINIDKMKYACEVLIGSHNFSGFSVESSIDGNPFREIFTATIEQTSFPPFNNEIYYLKIVGSGFLKYMVRYLMFALFEIGKGSLEISDFKKILTDGREDYKLKKAPPHGLHLMHISY